MAYPTSDLYKNRVFSSDPVSDIRVKLNGQEIDYDYLQELKLDDSCFESDNFALGSAIIQTVSLAVDNRGFEGSPEDITSASIDYGQILEDGTTEWIPIGVYDIVKEPDTSSSECTKFTLYDYMNRFDINYDGSDIVPCTRYELYQDICEKCNVEVGSDSFINGDVQVDVYDNTITARNYIQFLAERAGGYAKIDRTGKLCIKSFNNADIITLSEEQEDLIELEDYDSLKTITGVTYENAVNKWSFGNDDGEVIFLSDENVFVCSEEEVENIYNALNGLKFQSANFKMLVDPAWDTGDVIKFMGMQTFIQKSSWTYNLGFIGEIKTTLNSTKKMSNVQKISTPNKIKKLYALLDEENGKIEILTQQTDGNTSAIGELNITTDNIQTSLTQIDNEMNENFNEVTQTIDNLTVSIQNTGGSNLLKNSVMFGYNSDGIPTDWEVSEEGTLSMESSAEALNAGSISGHAFTLLGKTVKQRVYVKVNDSEIPEEEKQYYTFSTKIKKDATGTCYVKIYNEVEEHIIQLNSGESSFYGDYELAKLSPQMNYYDIEFYGSEDSNATFTDNMFAVGDYKSQWCQASGEIMNTQVNINTDGVLVKSSVYDGDYTVMSPLEFSGYSNVNGSIEKVFSLNKDTTEVKKLKAKDEIKMYPIKIVPITDGDIQGWAFVPTSEDGDY